MELIITVDAVCPVCEAVKLSIADVTISRPRGGSGCYSFRCPRCRDLVTKPANGRTLSLLAVAGAREAEPAGRAFTDNDLAAALALLDDGERFVSAVAELARRVGEGGEGS